MELYNEIYGAPIFDVYDDKEPMFDVADDIVAVLGCEYLSKNIQAIDSRITINICSFDYVVDYSIFASSRRNNEPFKEFIDVSHFEAFITRFWILRSDTGSALIRPIQSHEPHIPTPKKFNKEETVPVKPPPLRDKFAQLIASSVSVEGISTTRQLHPLRHNAIRRDIRNYQKSTKLLTCKLLSDVSFMTVGGSNFSIKDSSDISRQSSNNMLVRSLLHPAFFHQCVSHAIVSVSMKLTRSCSSLELVVHSQKQELWGQSSFGRWSIDKCLTMIEPEKTWSKREEEISAFLRFRRSSSTFPYSNFVSYVPYF